jgi:hypothetical protein
MMQEALGLGSAGVNRPVLTNVALVLSQPLLVMMVQEVLNQCQEVEVRLTTHTVADLAALERRAVVQVIICEPLAAEEIRGLLSPDQRLVILARGGTSEARPGELVLDLAGPNWSTTLAALVRAPLAQRAAPAERRRFAVPSSHRQLVAWLQQQHTETAETPESGLGSAAACQWALSVLPQLGQPTALIFLGMQRMARQAGEAAPLLQALRASLRTEDAIFCIDDLTVAILTPTPDVPSLLTRLSWRLWPSDPAALATGYAVWKPGEVVEEVIATAWTRLLTALGTPPIPSP